MSVLFSVDDQELWWPASAVAKVFVGQVQALEILVGQPSGLSPGNSDEIHLDPVVLRSFLHAVDGRMARSGSRVLDVLTAPAIAVLAALYVRCPEAQPSDLPERIRVAGLDGERLVR
jgi:hypothetical protein